MGRLVQDRLAPAKCLKSRALKRQIRSGRSARDEGGGDVSLFDLAAAEWSRAAAAGDGASEARLRNILYFHGFASSPRGRKVEALKAIFQPRGFRVIAPDLNIPSFERLDFRAMSRICVWELKKHLPAVVVGSSLGALVALEAGRTALAAPLVLVAPALGFGRRWIEKLPPGDTLAFFHHGEGRELLIHRRFFEDMARVDADEHPPPTPVIVLMGRRDESVPIEIVRNVWSRWQESGRLREGSRFVEIPQGDHGLTAHVDRIAEEILAAAERRSP